MTPAANLLLEQFDHLVSTPQDVERLNQAILDLAVRGKLTAQDPNDEPASELLAHIRLEKARMIEQNELPDREPIHPVAEDEALYDIPNSWAWVRLPEIAHNWGQKKPDATFSYIDVSSIDNQGGRISDDIQVIEPGDAPSRARKIAKRGSVIYSTVRPYLLNVATVDRDLRPEPIVSTAFYVLHPFSGVDGKFLYFYLRSKPFTDWVSSKMTGMAYPAISDAKLSEGLFPLPPTLEQHRIVERIERLFAQAHRLSGLLAEAQTDLAHLNESALAHLLAAETPEEFEYRWRFIAEHFHLLASDPAHIAPLRQTVLECAVRGMLTRQNPSDEPASELLKRIQAERVRLVEEGKLAKSDKLPPIGDDEKPFELPRGWEWVHLDDIADHRLGKMLDQHKNKGEYLPYLRNINVQWLRIDFNDVKELRFEDNEIEEYRLKVGDLLVCEGGEPGRCAIWENPDLEMMFQKAIHRVRPLGGILPKYTLYHLWADAQSGALDKYFTGATIKHFTGKALASYICALPPLAEQRRIVAKVEQLLTQCDALESKLGAAQADRERLVQSVMAGIEAG